MLGYNCFSNSKFSYIVFMIFIASQVVLVIKNMPSSAGDPRDEGLILGLGRSPGVENGNPFQYSCLGNPMDRGVWQATPLGLKELDTTAFIWG